MANVEEITNHEERALSRQLGQAGKPRFSALIGIMAEQTQEIEAELFKLYTDTWIENATGDALLQWGKIFRFPRDQNWTDDRYRALILAWILILLSKGTAEELIAILKRLAAADAVELFQIRPAQLLMSYQGSLHNEDQEWAASIIDYLQQAASSGILIGPLMEYTQNTFRFDIGPGLDQGLLAIEIAHSIR